MCRNVDQGMLEQTPRGSGSLPELGMEGRIIRVTMLALGTVFLELGQRADKFGKVVWTLTLHR